MRTRLLIASGVTPERNGKWSVQGLFPDDTILITLSPSYTEGPASAPPGVDNLACLVTVSGLSEGKHKFKGQLLDPLGKLNSETPALDFETTNDNSAVFPLQLQPFVVTGGAGTYTWSFQLDEQEFTHSFTVRLIKDSR